MKRRFVSVLSAVLCAMLVMPSVFSVFCSAEYFTGGLAKSEQKSYYKNEPSVMSLTPENVTFSTSNVPDPVDSGYKIDLDGVWKMTGAGKLSSLTKGEGWDDAIDAKVPGSIYTALYEAGVIPDPYAGDNMKTANKYSESNWYSKKTFDYKGGGKRVLLSFEGVCNVADFYLNGTKIGSHEGMFGGPYIDITDTVKQGENTLVVHLKPAKDYTKTVVFNCSYGWHYAKLYPLGIWQSVSVSDLPSVTLDHPFIATADYKKGTVDLAIQLDPANGGSFKGRLTVKVSPKNFDGVSAYFTDTVSGSGSTVLRYRADVPDAHLWWPNGYGEQYLYDLTVTFEENGGGTDYSVSEFGIRELSLAPFASVENSGTYNRQFVINGVNVYMKGAGWCTSDAMMRFSRDDYDRILSRAHDAGINFFRAWGGGLVETEEFYDLCDEYGICIYQEWPCCWDSTKTQPADVLYETVILGCKRLRNRPSLAVWGGGNEGDAPYNDKVLNNMGKLTYEYDGTRDFWRQDGGVGAANIRHDHIWWSGASPEHYLKTYTPIKNLNMHEYGLGSMMNRQSIEKFATPEEVSEWPLSRKNTIMYHTATFNGYYGWMQTPYGHDIATHMHYASLFTDVDSLDELILGSQLSQAQADYPYAINARIKAPYTSANVIYKMNDCYPGASWSIVDWYGAPKVSYYLMQDAYRPVMAAFLADRYNTIDGNGTSSELSLPVFILDDTVSLKGKNTSVAVTAYDENLAVIKTETFKGSVSSSVNSVGKFSLTAEQTAHTPMIITADLNVDGRFYNRTYMYYNYEAESGCLFYLPRTSLEYSVSGNTVTIKNAGSVPAIGVHLDTSAEDVFVCSDNYFMLTPGQSADVTISDASLFTGIGCFNFADATDKTAPTVPAGVKVSDITAGEAKVSWTASEDDKGLFGYTVTLTCEDGAEQTVFVHKAKTVAVITGLSEMTGYTVTVSASDSNSNVSERSAPVKFVTSPDLTPPEIIGADMDGEGVITVKFNTEMDAEKASDVSHYILNNNTKITSAAPSADGRSVTLKTEGADQSLSYTLGVIGLTDTKKSKNNTGYVEIAVSKSVYLTVGFEPDAEGRVFTSGKVTKQVTGINGEPRYVDGGYDGKALSVGSMVGVQIENVDFSFPDNSTVTIMINGKVGNGYNLLIAKGPKASGHFEFYTNSGRLFMYAPDIGDIDLKYNVNNGPDGWHQLAFIRENGMLTVYDGGVAVSKITLRGTVAAKTDTLSIGALNDGSLPYAGNIDSVCIYERALSPGDLIKYEPDSEPRINVGGNEAGTKFSSGFSLPEGSAINLWFNKESAESDFAILFAKGRKTSDKHFEIYTERGLLCFYAPVESVGSVSLKADLNAYIGSWHMLTVVHTEHTLDAYIDGLPVSSAAVDWAAAEGTDTCYCGRLVEGGFDFPGSIAECSFIDHLPGADEITELYNSHIEYPGAEGGVGFAEHMITLAPGETASLGVTATGSTKYTLSSHGDAATLDNETLTAVKPGETVIYARSDDGRYISAMLVTVAEPQEEQTEPADTEAEPVTGTEATETAAEPAGTTEPSSEKEKDGGNNTVLTVVIAVAAAAAAAVIAVVLIKKKKK